MSVATHVTTRGVVFVHSTPAVLCPHITWALEAALGVRLSLDWSPQPLRRGLVRTEYPWTGPQGTGARVVSALRGWQDLRFEVTEEPSAGCDGARWSSTPSLGIHHTLTSANGDAMVNEDRLRTVLEDAMTDPAAMREALDDLLGAAWDRELDPFRYAGDGAPVRWLHHVG